MSWKPVVLGFQDSHRGMQDMERRRVVFQGENRIKSRENTSESHHQSRGSRQGEPRKEMQGNQHRAGRVYS